MTNIEDGRLQAAYSTTTYAVFGAELLDEFVQLLHVGILIAWLFPVRGLQLPFMWSGYDELYDDMDTELKRIWT